MSTESADSAAPDDKPLPPRAPEAGECCDSGCNPCVYDYYWDAVARYEAELAAWQARHGEKI